MPKLTVYIPVDLDHAFKELKARNVDCSKLFCDAMLGHLSMCDDYEPPANTLEDLAIRLKRLEGWAADQIDKEDKEEAAPEVSGTVHLGLCGVGKPNNTFHPVKAFQLIKEGKCSLCVGCRRLFAKTTAHIDVGNGVGLCGAISRFFFTLHEIQQLAADGHTVCQDCLRLELANR